MDAQFSLMKNCWVTENGRLHVKLHYDPGWQRYINTVKLGNRIGCRVITCVEGACNVYKLVQKRLEHRGQWSRTTLLMITTSRRVGVGNRMTELAWKKNEVARKNKNVCRRMLL